MEYWSYERFNPVEHLFYKLWAYFAQFWSISHNISLKIPKFQNYNEHNLSKICYSNKSYFIVILGKTMYNKHISIYCTWNCVRRYYWILLILLFVIIYRYRNTPTKHEKITLPGSITYALRKLARATRYERNSEVKLHIESTVEKLKLFHTKYLFPDKQNILKEPLQHVTIVFDFVHEINMNRFQTILNGFASSRYRGVATLICFDEKLYNKANLFKKLLASATFIPIAKGTSHFYALVKLLNLVDTKYVFLARKMEYFNNFVSLEKLLNPLSLNKASVVGGANRDSLRHWKLGCYQTHMIWYHFRMIKGYDLSYNRSIYCDYIDGPFAAETNVLKTQIKNIPIDLKEDMLYLDLMVHMNKRSTIIMLCIECLFFTELTDVGTKEQWKPFVMEHALNKIILSDNTIYEYTCEEVGMKCKETFGKLLSYCCYKELHDLLLFSSEMFEKYHLQYELDSGSVLGSVKVDGTLYWEADHDLTYRTANITSLMKLQNVFKKAGYSLHEDKTDYKKCSTRVDCGYVRIKSRSDYWFIELWGQNVLSTDIYVEPDKELYRLSIGSNLMSTTVKGNVTLTRLGNKWVPTKSNPGAYSRGHYGVDVLQHAQHWRLAGKKSSFDAYNAGRWGNCSTPGFHGCANVFLADGNLQFTVWI